ncbi:MAG: DUF4340 domain-containing protein [Pirellulales bacterium]|nr:DUF4340 domain-containing protein [Pirellulales bacterium]
MSEMSKSSIFVGLALVLIVIAGYVQFSDAWSTEQTSAPTTLFPELTEPTAIAGLKITRFDETTAEVNEFEVKQVDGVWSIPSHDNYPADASNTHLAEAATALINMELKGAAVADLPTKHAEYGVVEPLRSNIASGGLGTKIILSNGSGSQLAELIIGNLEGTSPNLRYVRVPGQDFVYVAEIDTSALTTNLEDWVEADLLKISTFDIKSITIDDYAVDEQRGIIRKDHMEFGYDNSKPFEERWALLNAEQGATAVQSSVGDLSNALTRLQIVDVERKPADLVALLKGEESGVSLQTQQGLMSRGYFILQGQLFSNEGEVVVQMNNGVAYRIQFGEVAENASGVSSLDESVDATTEQAQQLNRYVFINAIFNPAVLEEPAMPEILKDSSNGGDTAEIGNTNGVSAQGDGNQGNVDQSGTGRDPNSQSDAGQDSTVQGSQDQNQGDNKAATQDADLEAQKRQAQIDYDAKLAEYQRKIAEGREKAAEEAARFANWYYIISDSVFRDIKVNREDVVEVVEQKNELEELQDLERQGIQGGGGDGQ